MDDFNVSSLHESKNEWGSRLLTILTPLIIEGFRSIFDESYKLCKDNNELDKYLMTFQNFITRIPKWNASIIEVERQRIIEKSGCNYLEELVTCVHIIQLKLLTAMRTGQKQKKIDINVPKLADFIHKTYIHVARKFYKNVYLFEVNIPPLQIQKNNRELEILAQESILNAIRESIPVESILRAYMDESVEEDIVEEVKEQITTEKIPPAHVAQTQTQTPMQTAAASTTESTMSNGGSGASIATSSGIKFNDVDMARDINNVDSIVSAPKDLETLEKLSEIRAIEQQLQDDLEDNEIKLKIHDGNDSDISFDIQDINPPEPSINLLPDLLSDVEILV